MLAIPRRKHQVLHGHTPEDLPYLLVAKEHHSVHHCCLCLLPTVACPLGLPFLQSADPAPTPFLLPWVYPGLQPQPLTSSMASTIDFTAPQICRLCLSHLLSTFTSLPGREADPGGLPDH